MKGASTGAGAGPGPGTGAGAPLPLAVFVGSWLPLSETFVYDQLRHQKHFRAHVFARQRGPHAAQFPYPHLTTLGPLGAAALFYAGRSSRIARELDRVAPRAIHAHFGLNGVLALPFARARGIPLAVTFHGHDVPGLLPERAFSLRYARYRRHARALFDYASILLCASSELAELLVQRIGAPEHKIAVHRLGVDLDGYPEQARDPEPLRVLMVGRLVEKQGMRYGLAAFAQLHAQRPDARLEIIGDGPLRATLEQEARALGIADAVAFRGGLPAAEVKRAMLEAGVLLAPSVVARDGDRESGMLVAKEAGAARLPIVASRHGGIPEIVEHGVTGFLVAERDARALGGHLLDLARDPALRTAMGRAARLKIEREYDSRVRNAVLEAELLRILR